MHTQTYAIAKQRRVTDEATVRKCVAQNEEEIWSRRYGESKPEPE